MQLQITNFLQDHTFFFGGFSNIGKIAIFTMTKVFARFLEYLPLFFQIVIFLHMILQELQYFLVQDCQFLCEIAKFCNKPPILGGEIFHFFTRFSNLLQNLKFWGQEFAKSPILEAKICCFFAMLPIFLQNLKFFAQIPPMLPIFPATEVHVQTVSPLHACNVTSFGFCVVASPWGSPSTGFWLVTPPQGCPQVVFCVVASP